MENFLHIIINGTKTLLLAIITFLARRDVLAGHVNVLRPGTKSLGFGKKRRKQNAGVSFDAGTSL
jgi:hypothetical protein